MALASTLKSATETASRSLDVYLLGVVDFDSALFLQERTLYDLSDRDDSKGVLIVCEHPQMITVGREGSHSHILCDSHELTSRQMDVRRLNRGGGCIVHAPGNWLFIRSSLWTGCRSAWLIIVIFWKNA